MDIRNRASPDVLPAGSIQRLSGDCRTMSLTRTNRERVAVSIRIEDVKLDVVREPLVRPFGFKGGYFTEKWLCEVGLTSSSGAEAIGVGGLAVLWSDPAVFSAHTEAGGNLIMATVLDHALQLSRGLEFETPMDLLDAIVDDTHAFARKVTGRTELTRTFTLNSLIALDSAAWRLYASEVGVSRFEELIPDEHRQALSYRHRALACVPMLGYGVPLSEIVDLVEQGSFVLKLKIGAPGDARQMLAQDAERLASIHAAVGGHETPRTPDGRIRYYLDANGRYPNKAHVCRLLDQAERIGMLDQICILEEPFPPGIDEHVGDLPVAVAADETLHDPADVGHKADLGYGCLALKPEGKTLSVSVRMASEALKRQIPCFVADSGCVPLLVDWNKWFAARLAPLPGFECGLIESNGHLYYRHWRQRMDQHPCRGAAWLEARQGLFELGSDFYARSGGLLDGGAYPR